MSASAFIQARIWLVALGAAFVGCGEGPSTPDAAASVLFGADVAFAKADATAAGFDGAPADGKTDAKTDAVAMAGDGLGTPTVVAVLASAATDTIELASRTVLTVQVQRDGKDAPEAPKLGEVTFLVDGLPLGLGAVVAATDQPQAGVSIWKGTSPAAFWLVGVRPGTASVVAQVGEVVAPPVEVKLTWPEDPILRVTLPAGSGKVKPERQPDAPDTVQLKGQAFGGGGLAATLKFPAAAVADGVYDFEKPPGTGALSLSATVADAGSTKVAALKGRLWIDQVDDGWFRGTFLALTAGLQPLAGVFVAERDGRFGIDLLGAPVQLAKSTTPQPATGDHMSRAGLGPIGGGKVIVGWRRISNVTSADLVRVTLDAKTGAIDTEPAPLVVKAPALDPTTTVALPALGRLAAALSANKALIAWEGRAGKGLQNPDKVWAWPLAGTGLPIGETPLEVSADPCHGQCRVEVARLPNSRWLVAWSAPGGKGVRARRLEGNLTWAEDAPVTMVQPPGTWGRAATFDANLALVWQETPGTAQFRLFSDSLAAAGLPPLALGAAVQAALPGPAVAAVQVPPSMLTFWLAPSGNSLELKARRVGLDGKKFGPADISVAPGVAGVVVAGGKLGQAALVERVAGLSGKPPGLRVRKWNLASVADPGAQLGAELTIPTGTKLPVEPSLAYVPESDVFVLAWSGDGDSEGVWVMRFR
ncbi:MAG: hypothetical protein EXR79_15250 [Myxococcales bacterium]|nr:hypothetical protein [Myxococcales bacterium]